MKPTLTILACWRPQHAWSLRPPSAESIECTLAFVKFLVADRKHSTSLILWNRKTFDYPESSIACWWSSIRESCTMLSAKLSASLSLFSIHLVVSRVHRSWRRQTVPHRNDRSMRWHPSRLWNIETDVHTSSGNCTWACRWNTWTVLPSTRQHIPFRHLNKHNTT